MVKPPRRPVPTPTHAGVVSVDATDEARKNFKQLQKDPLWASLGAVRRGMRTS
jgi:hypothetical protein